MNFFPGRLDFGIFTSVDLKKTSTAYDSMARSADPKLFERHPHLSLKASRPKPQKKYEKTTIVRMIFGNKLLSSFLMLAIPFSLLPMLQTDTDKLT